MSYRIQSHLNIIFNPPQVFGRTANKCCSVPLLSYSSIKLNPGIGIFLTKAAGCYDYSTLHIALDEIKRSDGRVSQTTAKDSAKSASSVECRQVHLNLLSRFIRRRDDKAPCLDQ
ncbi:hypothetical protein SLE2022_152230 [Rubroshorea leprosula]